MKEKKTKPKRTWELGSRNDERLNVSLLHAIFILALVDHQHLSSVYILDSTSLWFNSFDWIGTFLGETCPELIRRSCIELVTALDFLIIKATSSNILRRVWKMCTLCVVNVTWLTRAFTFIAGNWCCLKRKLILISFRHDFHKKRTKL